MMMLSFCSWTAISSARTSCPAKEPYLTGAVVFFRTDNHGNIVSLTVEDIYRFQTYLETHSVTLMADDQKLPCICIG